MPPTRPTHVDRCARVCLEALAGCPAAARVSLGGAFGLAHYHEFRGTHDVDAWWDDECTGADRRAVIDTLKQALRGLGEVVERRHGDVVSVELVQEGRTVFSFQIARRSARLANVTDSPWPPVKLDAFEDLVAAKMAALVERGAPRDFVDIHELCRASLTTVVDCWRLWERRERGRGVHEPDRAMGAEAALVHLSRIERLRPLRSIASAGDRDEARRVRDWFRDEFIKPQIGLD